VADFTDDRALMGASHNVFVGKVLEQIGTKERGIGPETQFKVQVIENIKGELDGEVVVDQEGGYKNGILYIFGEGDGKSYLLQPGSTYLFATRYNKNENWYTLISHPAGKKVISSDGSMGQKQLKMTAQSDNRVIELKEAYKDEIPLDADVKNNNSLNNYEATKENTES
jgi:hypothetical protein